MRRSFLFPTIGFVLGSAALLSMGACPGGFLAADCEVEIDDECLDDLFTNDDDEGFFQGVRELLDD